MGRFYLYKLLSCTACTTVALFSVIHWSNLPDLFMKHLTITATVLLMTLSGFAQTISAQPDAQPMKKADTFTTAVAAHSWLASISFGFINGYRQEWSVPSGFEKNNTSGFTPIYGRLEYMTSRHVGIAATVVYNEYYANYYRLYTGNGQEYKRGKTDMTLVYSGGLSINYHLGSIIPVKKMDVFITGGFLLNSIHHSALPQGDSIVTVTDRSITPVLKAGVRYYISNRSSFIADAGYDKQSIFSLGYSCRFLKKP